MEFEEMIAMMRNPGEDGIPETIYDDLSASYTEMSSTSNAKITQVTGELEALQLELIVAKAANWDLLQNTGIDDSSDSGDDGDSNSDNDSDSDPDDVGTDDDFFEKKED